jgi:hypothetical protein
MKEIINPWHNNNSSFSKPVYKIEGKPVYSNGDYHIYKQFNSSYMYVYKDLAFNNLAGINKHHLDAVATRTRPKSPNAAVFLYDRAIETLEKATSIKRNQ